MHDQYGMSDQLYIQHKQSMTKLKAQSVVEACALVERTTAVLFRVGQVDFNDKLCALRRSSTFMTNNSEICSLSSLCAIVSVDSSESLRAAVILSFSLRISICYGSVHE